MFWCSTYPVYKNGMICKVHYLLNIYMCVVENKLLYGGSQLLRYISIVLQKDDSGSSEFFPVFPSGVLFSRGESEGETIRNK